MARGDAGVRCWVFDAQVQGVILDPSCSGSGTVFTRMDHLLPSFQRRQQQQQQQQQQQGGGQPALHEIGKCSDTDSGAGSESSIDQGRWGSGDDGSEGTQEGCSGGGNDVDLPSSVRGTGGTGGPQGCTSEHSDAERIRHLANFQVSRCLHEVGQNHSFLRLSACAVVCRRALCSDAQEALRARSLVCCSPPVTALSDLEPSGPEHSGTAATLHSLRGGLSNCQ